MKAVHAEDQELQQFAMDPSGCSKESREHIEGCEICQAEAAIYTMLISDIGEQTRPAFDFDLADAILSQLTARADPLPAAATGVSRFGFSVWLLAALVSCTIGIPIYLFRKNIWNMFTQVSGLFIYIILGAAVIVVIYRIMSMYKKYQQQIDTINFY